MASRRKKKAAHPRSKKNTPESSKKKLDNSKEVVSIPTRKSYAFYGSLLIVFTIFNFMYIASNLVLTLISFLGMLYTMNRIVYVYVLRKRISEGGPEQKPRF